MRKAKFFKKIAHKKARKAKILTSNIYKKVYDYQWIMW
jgi:hypothetical protein